MNPNKFAGRVRRSGSNGLPLVRTAALLAEFFLKVDDGLQQIRREILCAHGKSGT